jgi:Carboxypeptidase regulatory-like domain
MTNVNPESRSFRRSVIGVVALLALLPLANAGAQVAAGQTKTSPGYASIQGAVMDSVHGVPLVGAIVQVDGTARSAITRDDGHYAIDSIPAGAHRLVIGHPLTDTIGIAMSTAPIPFASGEHRDLDIAIPTGDRLVEILCPAAARRVLGPAALIGFVRDPDTGQPAFGAKVQLVFVETDPFGLKKTQRVRESPVDSAGNYRICGLPAKMTGKVQVFRNGVSSGEVPAELQTELLGLRSFSIVAEHKIVATVKGDSGQPARLVARGTARVSGRVLNKQGQMLGGARVSLQGGDAIVITRPNGEFTLDSLPSGTQSIEVRKLGYGATEASVELSSITPSRVTVTMDDYVPTLQAMRVEAERDRGLMDVGYLQRKQIGQGYYLDGDAINKQSTDVTDVLRLVPSLKVVPAGDGRSYTVAPARDPSGGCVAYVVDRMPWREASPGDIVEFVRPDELRAVEVYSASNTPPELAAAGRSGCTTIVMWTVRGVTRGKAKGK